MQIPLEVQKIKKANIEHFTSILCSLCSRRREGPDNPRSAVSGFQRDTIFNRKWSNCWRLKCCRHLCPCNYEEFHQISGQKGQCQRGIDGIDQNVKPRGPLLWSYHFLVFLLWWTSGNTRTAITIHQCYPCCPLLFPFTFFKFQLDTHGYPINAPAPSIQPIPSLRSTVWPPADFDLQRSSTLRPQTWQLSDDIGWHRMTSDDIGWHRVTWASNGPTWSNGNHM